MMIIGCVRLISPFGPKFAQPKFARRPLGRSYGSNSRSLKGAKRSTK
jgi:hypothetical protein